MVFGVFWCAGHRWRELVCLVGCVVGGTGERGRLRETLMVVVDLDGNGVFSAVW